MKKGLTVKQKNKGFTLLELMAVISIVAIMATIAAPSFQRQTQRSEVRRTASDFQATLEDAKRKAYVAGRNYTVCPVKDITAAKPKCEANWNLFNGEPNNEKNAPNKGWIAFADLNNNGQVDNNELVITKNTPNSNIAAMKWEGANGIIKLTPRNSVGSKGTMRVYAHKNGKLSDWDKSKDPDKDLHEMRVELSALGSVKFFN